MPPDIISDETSGDVSVQELENATLTCKATGHPSPKITWRREDHEPVLLKKPQSRDFDKGKIGINSDYLETTMNCVLNIDTSNFDFSIPYTKKKNGIFKM